MLTEISFCIIHTLIQGFKVKRFLRINYPLLLLQQGSELSIIIKIGQYSISEIAVELMMMLFEESVSLSLLFSA